MCTSHFLRFNLTCFAVLCLYFGFLLMFPSSAGSVSVFITFFFSFWLLSLALAISTNSRSTDPVGPYWYLFGLMMG